MRRSFYGLMLVLILSSPLAAPAPLAARGADGAGNPPAAGPAAFAAPAGGSTPAGPVIVESDDRHIVLEWAAPPYEMVSDMVGGQTVQQIRMPDCPPAGVPGEPDLPICSALLGVPPDAALTLRIVETETVFLGAGFRLPPRPDLAIEPDLPAEAVGRPPVIREVRVEGPAYGRDDPFPAEPAALGEAAFLRHQRIAAIAFFPLQYRPRSGELVYHPRVRLEISWGETGEPTGYVPEPAAFERLLAASLLNYGQARAWRRTTAQPLEIPPAPPDPGWRIPVRREGIYKLSYQRLQAAGLPVDTLDPRTLRLYCYGEEVAIRVVGEEDGQFDSLDYVLFYGRPLADNRYTDSEVYWLTYGGLPGRRMARRDGTPAGVAPVPSSFVVTEHLEQDLLYTSSLPWRADHSHWFWNYTYPEGNIPAQEYHFPAHPLAMESYTATLRLAAQGYTSDMEVIPDHHIRVLLNGTLLGELWWDGREELIATFALASPLLQASGNTARFEAPGDTGAFADLALYDWLELEHRRRFVAEQDRLDWAAIPGYWEYHLEGFTAPGILLLDVGDPTSPVEVVSATVVPAPPGYALYFEATMTSTTEFRAAAEAALLEPVSVELAQLPALRDPGNGADYIVVGHADFSDQAATLASFWAGRGLRATAVDVADLYDLFAYGRQDAEAIRAFLAYTYENWSPPAPAYVVLLGDGHYDPMDHYGYGVGNFIYPYLAWVDPWLGQVAADNRYVCVSGQDILPDMHLGRLPANTPAQAQVMVDKIIAYESAPPPGAWRRQALFVADNADDAGDFAAISQALIAGYISGPYQADRVFLGVTHPYQWPAVIARGAIIAAINAGRVLVNYVGHASATSWAAEGLLNVDSLSGLANAPYYPVTLAMACAEGQYFYPLPNYSGFAEAFVRSPNGWIASWSPTGMGLAAGHNYLNEGFLQAVFLDDGWQLGPATLAGKLRLWAAETDLDLLDTYLLFGDPALEMPLLKTDLALDKAVEPPTPLRPGDPITFTLALTNAGPATAHHIVLDDALSPYIVSPTVSAGGIALTARPGTRYTWDVADMVAGRSGTVTISAHLSWQTPVGTYLNAALLTTTAHETSTQNNADMVSLQVVAGPPYAVAATAEPPAIPADGASQSLIQAHVADTAGNPVADGTPVAFRTDHGTFPNGDTYFATTTAQGNAGVLLRSSAQVVTATVTITSGQAMGAVQVPFASLEPHTILLESNPTAIPLTGTAALTATVRDVLGHPVRDGTGVTLTTTLGHIGPATGPTRGGIFTSTLYGEGLAGLATVVARSGRAAGTAAVRIGEGSSYTLTLEVSPPALPADGQSTAALTATLVRADGQPLTGTHWVSFSTTLGTITPGVGPIDNATATAAATLTAATRAGTAWVMAVAERESALVTVTLFPGEAAGLVLTVSPASIPVGGSSAAAMAVVGDAYGNAVADGTPVAFATDRGIITPTLGTTRNGRAQAVLFSGTQAGTATVSAQSGPAGATAAVRFTPLSPFTLTLAATPSVVVADGRSASYLSAWVGDRFANPVADGTAVSFYTTLGTLRPPQAPTVQGWATATLTSTAVGTATVRSFAGQSGNAEDHLTVRFVVGPPATLLLTASPTRLYADGVTTSTVTAYLWDGLGHPVADGTPVTLTTSLGTISPELVWTANGHARGELRSARVPGWAVVQASGGPAQGQVRVEFFQYRLYLPLIVR